VTKIASKFACELASALADAESPTNQPSDNVKDTIDRFRHALETVGDADDTQESRSTLPQDAADWLNEALGELNGTESFNDAVAMAAKAAGWYQIYNDDAASDNTESSPMRDLASGMYAARLIGPHRGLVQSDQMLAGLFLLRKGLHYPLHQHQSTEIYFAASGTVQIQHDINGKPKTLLPGQVSLTPPNRLHALTMGDRPVLILWVWLGEFGGRNWWWHRQDSGDWRRDAWERSSDASWVKTASEQVPHSEIIALQPNDNQS
tara:strand:+ start:407 stop:1195 length:789 start_codon:yes stop_codon:yes gene_type:complete